MDSFVVELKLLEKYIYVKGKIYLCQRKQEFKNFRNCHWSSTIVLVVPQNFLQESISTGTILPT